MNSFMKDSKTHTRTNSITSPQNSREGMTVQVQRMKLEADLLLEGGDIPQYITKLDEIYAKIKVDNRFKRLIYEIAQQFQKFGYLEKSLTILAILYEETSRYDDDCIKKTKMLFQFALDIANWYFSIGRFKKAFEFYSSCLKYHAVFSSWDLSMAQLYSNKGLCCLYLNDYDVAEGYFRKAMKWLIERMQDPRKEKLLMVAYKNLGCIYELKKDPKKSLSFYVKALKSGLKVYSPDHIEIADIHYQIWCALLDEDKMYESMQRLEKVVNMLNRDHEALKESSDSYLPKLGSYYALLGQFYFRQGHFENAQKWFEATLSAWHEYGMNEQEEGYQRILELEKVWLIKLNN